MNSSPSSKKSNCDSEWAIKYQIIQFPGKMKTKLLLQCYCEDQMKYDNNNNTR